MPGRNAAQLRAAALATGWWDGPHLVYVGDGASVPWEVGYYIPWQSLGGFLYAYKVYLDARWPAAFRLHDWLYTPYGALINVTRDEADNALYEDIAPDSPIDAQTVYTACNLGGGPYFGVSTVGYVPPPGTAASGPNMGEASTVIRSGPVADFKVVMVFNQTTRGTVSQPSVGYTASARQGGWSESHWVAGVTLDQLRQIFVGPRNVALPICQARAALLPEGGVLKGIRIYEATGGRGQFFPVSFGNNPSWTCDQPQNALLLATSAAGATTVRRFDIRSMPDGQIVSGEYTPDTQFATALRLYTESLVNTSVRGRVVTAPIDVFNVSAAGLVTARSMPAAPPYSPNAIVTISRTKDSDGILRSGEFVIATTGVPATNAFTVRDWPYGRTEGGTIKIITSQFFTVSSYDTKVERTIVHKIGRPFGGYRGRRSKKRAAKSMPPA